MAPLKGRRGRWGLGPGGGDVRSLREPDTWIIAGGNTAGTLAPADRVPVVSEREKALRSSSGGRGALTPEARGPRHRSRGPGARSPFERAPTGRPTTKAAAGSPAVRRNRRRHRVRPSDHTLP